LISPDAITLECSAPFDPTFETGFSDFPASPAVFALFPGNQADPGSQPYLSYTCDLRRRLARLLRTPKSNSKLLNLHAVTRRIEFQTVGSNFEAQWLLFRLNRFYYPRRFRRRLRLRFPNLIKVNLRNRFPRCYATARMAQDGSLYYGPFPSRAAAERFTGDFLDLYKTRRCVPDLNPDPSHPGCMYSQMKMCLAPCFKGCTDEEYYKELNRALAFLDSDGADLISELEAEREHASGQLEFEQAARAHRLLEKAREVIRLKPPLVKEIAALHAIVILPASRESSLAFFRIVAGEIRGPVVLSLQENVSSPVSLDQQLNQVLAPLGQEPLAEDPSAGRSREARRRLPAWEHLSLLARWYYSSFRVGEIVMLRSDGALPHARLVRLCRKVLNTVA
jgi:excinuclease ABC subunit C